MPKPKLLIVGAFPAESKAIYGGIAKSCKILLESSIANRFDIDTLDSSQISNPPPKLFIRSVMAVRRLFILMYRLIFNRIDVVLIFSSDGASAIEKGVMVWMCHLFKRPALIFPRAGNLISQTSRSPLMLKLIRFLYGHSTVFLCQGVKWKGYAINQLGLDKSKVKVVNNWTATEKQIEIGKNRKSELNNTSKLIFVGWLEKYKGVFELLYACNNLHNKGIRFHLTFVGSGNAEKAAKHFVKEHNLKKCIVFFGWANSQAVDSILEKSDIFVLPSWAEGFPNAMIEAMAAGLATVVTSVGVILDYVKDGEHAIIVPPYDVAALESALTKIILDTELRKSIASNGHQLAIDSFSVEENTKRLGDIIGMAMR
ncbi:Exopolysaccharide biosynthesis glycosyltransferase EpsF [uncultured Candidatus Thioglobus sp.]|nr:Exopolysaccharide biosynthesis glycosyltransferase EpsF [uncultured Candidatus Thioglobus sp.]